MRKQVSNQWLFGFIAFVVVLIISFSMMFIIEKEAVAIKKDEMQTHEKRIVNLQKDTLESTFKMIQGDINYLHDIYRASYNQNKNLENISKNFFDRC